MAKRIELDEQGVESVVGGMSRTNNFGDGQTYYVGASAGNKYSFSFAKSDIEKYNKLGDSVWVDGMTREQYDAAMLVALASCDWAKAIDVEKGSLTPIF